MKRFLKSKKGLALLAALVVAIAASVGAYAYFTTTGSGTGSASVGTSSNLVLAGTTADTLYPGTHTTVSFTALNSSPGHQQLGTIYLAGVKACNPGSWNGTNCGAGGTEITTCESINDGSVADNPAANQFYMGDVTSNQDFGPGASPQAVSATGVLYFHNLAASQDQCKNANLTLLLSTR
jgi:hypothetical protein